MSSRNTLAPAARPGEDPVADADALAADLRSAGLRGRPAEDGSGEQFLDVVRVAHLLLLGRCAPPRMRRGAPIVRGWAGLPNGQEILATTAWTLVWISLGSGA